MQCSIWLSVHAQSRLKSLAGDGERERDMEINRREKESERARQGGGGGGREGRGSIILGFHSYRKHHSHRLEFIVDTMWEALTTGAICCSYSNLSAVADK